MAIFPGAPAGTPLAPGAEGLAAFGALSANPDAAPAFGSMLAAATAAPAEPGLATAATQDGVGNPPMLATPAAVPVSTCPTAQAGQAAMPVPFHWSPAEETPAQMTPDFATNEELAVDLEMNASADRGGMPPTTAEPATTNASAPMPLDEPIGVATVGVDVQPTVAPRQPEAPTTLPPTTIERTDLTGQEVPVGPARTQSRPRSLTVPNATRPTVRATPAVAFSTSAASVSCTGRREISTTKTGASTMATPLTGGWRNPAGPVVKSAPVAAVTIADDSIATVLSTPEVVSPVLPVAPAAVPSAPAATIVAPSQPTIPVDQAVAVAPVSVATNSPSTGTEQPSSPVVEIRAFSGENPASGHRSTIPVAAQPTPSAQPMATVAVARAAVAPATVLPVTEIVASLPPRATDAVAPVAANIAPSQPVVLVAGAPIGAISAPSQSAMPVAQPAMVAANDAVIPIPTTTRPVISRAGAPKFQVELPGVDQRADLPAGPRTPTVVTPATMPAAPIAATVMPTPLPLPAAASVVAVVAPAVMVPVAVANPISAGQGIPQTPVSLLVGMANPVVPPDALPALPATPEAGPDAAAVAQPKIYEQQILAGQNEPMPSLVLSVPARSEFSPPIVPLTVAPEIQTGNDGNPTGETPALPAPAGKRGLGVPPMSAEDQTTGAVGPEIQDLPTPAIGTFTIPAPSQPVIVLPKPAAIVPAFDATVLSSTADEEQIPQLPEATLSPVEIPVVEVAPAPATETKTSISTGSSRPLPPPVTAGGAGFPWLQTQGAAPVAGQAIATPTREHPPSPGLPPSPGFRLRPASAGQVGRTSWRDQSSLLQLNDLISGDVKVVPLANLATLAAVPVPALPVPESEAPLPVPLATPAVVDSGSIAATPNAAEPNVTAPPVLSGLNAPVPPAAQPVADISQSARVTVPLASVAKPISAIAPAAVVAPEISPARANETKPAVGPGSRTIRKGRRPLALEATATPVATPALASTSPLMSVAVAPTAVTNPGIPTTTSPLAPVTNTPPVSPVQNAVVRPVMPPAVLPAVEAAVPISDGVPPSPQLPRPATAIPRDDLAPVPVASLPDTPTPAVPEPGSAPTWETDASVRWESRSTPVTMSRHAPAAAIPPVAPADLRGNPANITPTVAVAPTGLSEVSSAVSAPGRSVGNELPTTAPAAAFSAQFHAASRAPVTVPAGDARAVMPSPEDADPVTSAMDFSPRETIRMRPTAEAIAASLVAASGGIATAPIPRSRAAVATKPAAPSDNPAPAISPGLPVPARMAGSGEAAMPAEPLQRFAPPAGTPSETSGANTAPAAPVEGPDVKPESFSPVAPASDTAATPLPVSNSGEQRGQPASVAAGADMSLTAEIPLAGAVPEKFAVQVAMGGVDLEGISEGVSVKNTLKVDRQQEVIPPTHAGINTAKKSGTMLTDQPQTSSAAPISKSPTPAADTAARVGVATITAPKPEASRTEWVQPAGRTLAIVRDVAERMQTTANRVVEFDVISQPGTQLTVRLEYRGGVVHTTFRTDSTDLRETLAREWQSAMPSVVAGERSVRLAEPTFTPASAPRGESQAFDLGGQTPRQQQQNTPQSQEKAAFGSEFASAREATARRPAAPAPAADTPAASALRPDTAKHLHAFA